jgi:beta-phosphoglucomutase-like phosphatase (HAD superfamily)
VEAHFVKGFAAPDCYLLALERLGVAPAECLAIEDTQYGLEAAHGAGISSVAVPSDMSSHHDFRHASAILGSMSELGDYLKDLLFSEGASIVTRNSTNSR